MQTGILLWFFRIPILTPTAMKLVILKNRTAISKRFSA